MRHAACRQARSPRHRAMRRRGWRRPRRRRTTRCPTTRSDRRRAPRCECARGPGASTTANSTLVRSGNAGWCSSAGPSRANRASSGSGPSTTHCGLPTAAPSPSASRPALEPSLAMPVGAPSRRRTGTTRPTRRSSTSRLDARRRLDDDLAIDRRPVRATRARPDRRQASQSVAGQLRRAAVGVEQRHRRARGGGV